MSRKSPFLLLICICLLTFSCFTTTVMAETKEDNPITSVDLETIVKKKNNTEVTLSYVLENKKTLILKTDQEKVIDVDALKKELGADKVVESDDKKELQLTLDKPDKIDFKMYITKEKPFLLTVQDADKNKIFDYLFNAQDRAAVPADEEGNDEESSWTLTNKLMVSKGPILEHKDGSSTQPILYFGDYNFAEKGNQSISTAWEERGASRVDSLTAPNSGIIYAEPGSRIEDGLKSSQNHIYTTHYGDSQKNDYSTALQEAENTSYGSPTSYTSNNLFNYVVNTDNRRKPGTAGPNKLGKSYSMIDEPTLYHRINPKTGFEEQRLVYKQRAYYVDKRGRSNPEITTSIKMSFTRTGRVNTDISYKNTGSDLFENFIGFSNHDLSLNKDGGELIGITGKKSGNFIPMRALGNERGMYLQDPGNEIRTSFYMNQNNGPGGWAARSASRSYLATKGYLYNPGLLGLTPIRETYYPWKVGKGGSSFFDRNNNVYKFPYTPSGYHNAFRDQNDTGDKGKKKPAGTRLGTKTEKDPNWDSGVTMRTVPASLPAGTTVHLSYGTMTDVPGSTFNPVAEFDSLGTEEEPQIKQLGTKELTFDGHWYDFDSKNVKIYYSIDTGDSQDIKKNVLLDENQTQQDADNGTFHDFSKVIDISALEKGAHKISFMAEDEDGNQSVIQHHNFKLIKKVNSSDSPQIDVTSPIGTIQNPHVPITDKLDLSGSLSYGKSKKIKTLSYSIDDQDEVIHKENISNYKPGRFIPWNVNGLDIHSYNDLKRHKIDFKVTTEDGKTDTDTFYFQHAVGSTHLVAPAEIDFGKILASPNADSPISPDLKDKKVLLEDFRSEGAGKLGVSLTIDKFYKDKDYLNDDNDDGDDSESNMDGDGDEDDDGPLVRTEESLLHDVYWDGQAVNSENILIGKTAANKNNEWRQITDFTDEVSKKLKINFRSGAIGATPGKYISRWTWQTIDSIED